MFRKAADQGNADAQSNLGVMYKYGWGVPKNLKEALKWYSMAVKNGRQGLGKIIQTVKTQINKEEAEARKKAEIERKRAEAEALKKAEEERIRKEKKL